MRFSLLLLSVCWLFAGSAFAQDTELPSGVAWYYEARQFVSAFSTPEERTALARKSLSELDSSSSSKTEERLRAVDSLMHELVKLELEPDPGFIHHPDRTAPTAFSVTPEVVQIDRFSRDDGSIFVVVSVHALNEESNQHLIDRYEREQRPRLSDLPELPVRHQEIHEWKKVDDTWRKKRGAWRLLEKD